MLSRAVPNWSCRYRELRQVLGVHILMGTEPILRVEWWAVAAELARGTTMSGSNLIAYVKYQTDSDAIRRTRNPPCSRGFEDLNRRAQTLYV